MDDGYGGSVRITVRALVERFSYTIITWLCLHHKKDYYRMCGQFTKHDIITRLTGYSYVKKSH